MLRLFSTPRQQNLIFQKYREPSFPLSLHSEINGSEKALVNTTNEIQPWHEKAEANIEISLGYKAKTKKMLNKTGFFSFQLILYHLQFFTTDKSFLQKNTPFHSFDLGHSAQKTRKAELKTTTE